jgi:CATRA-Associated Small Protein
VEELEDDAADVLSDALEWTLTPARWQGVQDVVARLEAALAAGDRDALRAAVCDLELLGPVRGASARSAPQREPGPTPGPLRERINELIHQINEP